MLSCDGYFKRLAGAVTITCLVSFAIAATVSWFAISRASMREAEERLRAASDDIRKEIAACVDEQLYYIGNAICRHYKRPEAMTQSIVDEVMDRYNIDELNVVDSKGIVIAGAIADIGYDMGSNPKSAEFNRLLEGVTTYCQAFRGSIEDPRIRRKYAGIAFPPPAKGYIQIGFEEARVKDGIDYWFGTLAEGWHIGETGFFVVANEGTGLVDSCGMEDAAGGFVHRKGDTLASIGFDAAAAPGDPDTFFTATLYGVECLCLTEVCSFHRFIAAIPLSEIRGGSVRTIVVVVLVLLVVFAAAACLVTRLSALVATLRRYIAAEAERQEKDLSMSKLIQTSSLPVVFPDTPVFKIFALMATAREVGGDFYDFYTVPSGRTFFLIADVSGKGIPAALFMMQAKAIVKACAFQYEGLAEAVAEANNRLAENNDAQMFVTAWLGAYDERTGEVEYVNAGHNPPLIKRADGSVEWVKGKPSLVLAAMAGTRYRAEKLVLSPGDSILLYTDGVTEAMNRAGELYGEERLERALAAAGREFATAIREDVAAFVDGAEQSDDITMMALDVKPVIKE